MKLTLNGNPSFKITRTDDESGDIMLVIDVEDEDGDVEINCGRFSSDADALLGALQDAAKEAKSLADDWEDRPDEFDGYVTEDRGTYRVVMESTRRPANWREPGYPTREIATYELAKLMVESGCYPNAWYQNERGDTDDIGAEVYAFQEDGPDALTLKPLEGVEFSEDDTVIFTSDPYQDPVQWTVVADYGTLGLILSSYGEREFFDGEQRAQVKLYEDDEE
jgi:hypothetical protein